MKRLILTVFVLMGMQLLHAIPAKREVSKVKQSDGSLLEIMQRGDESFHFYTTTDGLPLTETSEGFTYASVINGNLISTDILAHNKQERSLRESSYLLFSGSVNKESVFRHWHVLNASRNSHRLARSLNNRKLFSSKQVKSRSASSSITKKGLVILVNFSDSAMKYKLSDFNPMFNQKGYSKNRHIGSVRDYFTDQSYGQLTIDFDVVGPYTLKNKLAYYGENESNGDDKHAGEMVAEACKLADKDVNFSDYDWDGDGEVDQVYVIYAGYGEASWGSYAPQRGKNTIWPHEWTLSDSDFGKRLQLDNVTINTYACSNELAGTSGTVMDGIGTACHEFSHCLGIPDLYDTSGVSFGMATWSVMDYGCYNGPYGYEGCVPAAYTAYERFYCGWLEPTVLSEGCEVKNMSSITDSQDSYIIYNEKYENEYYILTNIQQSSWNKYAEGHGLLVIHVDYDEDAWFGNSVNDEANHHRCSIIAADNEIPSLNSSEGWESLAGDPYPGTSNNYSLTNISSPAAMLFNSNSDGKKYMNKPIEQITENNGKISFKFNGGPQLSKPIATEASDITDIGFTANWNAVENADSYTLELFETYEADIELLLSEDFSKLKNSSVNSSDDISADLDQYTTKTGWKGSKLFHDSSHGIKLGSSRYEGTLQSPTLSSPKTSTVTVYITANPYGASSTADLVISIGKKSQTINCNGRATAVHFSDISDSFNVTIVTSSSNKRAYIDEIKIYDGEVSSDDLTPDNTKHRITAKRSIRIVTDIKDTFYTFTDLATGAYYYRVKALSTEINPSPWSDMIEVQTGASEPIVGDVNEDGIVDISDIVAVINTMAGTTTWRYADVNKDNNTDISDIVSIINIMAGKSE